MDRVNVVSKVLIRLDGKEQILFMLAKITENLIFARGIHNMRHLSHT